MKQKQKRGQTIVEVIIAIAVVSVVITAVAAVISVSLQNTSRAKANVIGTKFTQEGIEYFRAQRNLMGWEFFLMTLSQPGSSVDYCLATLPYSTNDGLAAVPNRPCTLMEFADSHNMYKRNAQVILETINGQETVTVTVTTVWPDSDHTAKSTATVQFQNPQK